MDINEFRCIMLEDIMLASEVNSTNVEEEFINYVVGILIDADEFGDFIESYYENRLRLKSGEMRIDGYYLDDMDGVCNIIISDFRGQLSDNQKFIKADIDSSFKKVKNFVRASIEDKLYTTMEESTSSYELAKYIYDSFSEIHKYKFYILTDIENTARIKNIKEDNIGDSRVEVNVWDLNRIYEIVNSKSKKESIEIQVSDEKYPGIPCVKAVNYDQVPADIIELTDEGNMTFKISYDSYLAVVPGEFLNKIYLDYGSRILEGNVRSFLSVRGKVNKSIQNTIKNYPEMFFAYNNGIAATATNVETRLTEQGLVITRIKDLQIVNGGQTTASIANTVLSAKKEENINLHNLYVPMKLSVLDQDMSERIIPKISEYSNSQNKVDASDFFSNHPFHIRMEEYSRKTPAPAIGGNQYQQYWFYERTRGQYNQGKMKFKPKSKELRQYELKYPAKQVIKSVELAKYMNVFNCKPHIVSKGGQENIKIFAPEIKASWNKSDKEFNVYYFKRLVALAIMYKTTDDIIKNTIWYKEKKSYKANVIAYTMSVLINYVNRNHKELSIDYLKIWNSQELYPELIEQIKLLCTEVYYYITDDSRLNENVTEWCKKELCWTRASVRKWNIKQSFIETLVPKDSIREEDKKEKNNRKIQNEIDNVSYIIKVGGDYWIKAIEWGSKRKLLSDIELSLFKIAANIESTGRIPSDLQAKKIKSAHDRLIQEGMPI